MKNSRLLLLFLAFLVLEMTLVQFTDRPFALYCKSLGKTYPDLISFFDAYTDIGLGVWYAWPSGILTLLGIGALRYPKLSEKTKILTRYVLPRIGFFFVATSLAGLLTDAIKPILGRARPSLFLTEGVYGFAPLADLPKWNSMPSGHTTTGFAVAFSLMALFPRMRIWALLFALSIGLSRLIISAHYLSDTLAGVAVAAITTMATHSYFKKKGWLRH